MNHNQEFSESKEAKSYHAIKNRLFFIQLFLNIALLCIFFFSGLSLSLRNLAQGYSSNIFVINGIYIMIFSLGALFLSFPLDIYEGHFLEHRFGLSNQNLSQYLKDDAKKMLINLLVMFMAFEMIYVFLRRFPFSWWLWAGGFWLFLTLILARLLPNVIIPFFYKYSDLKDQELKQRVITLFQKSGITIKDAYAIDFSAKTKKANAFVCGLGNNRRVVLGDTLIENFSHDEIETVLGHEIGHYKSRDIVKITAVNSLTTLAGFFLVDILLKEALLFFGLTRLDDVAFFPVMALGLIVLSFCIMPILNAYSRYLEKRADLFSLELCHKPDDFISAFQKLGALNLAEFEPSPWMEWLFYSHPSLSKRIRFIQQYKDAHPKAA